MADPVVKFEPYMTAKEPGGSLILDRNLIEIKKALADANATFITIKTAITNIISSINITFATTGVSAPPHLAAFSLGGDDEGDGGGMGPPGQAGAQGAAGSAGPQGNSGPPGFGVDGEDGQDGYHVPGPQGPQGSAGSTGPQGAAGTPGFATDGEDGNDSGARMDFSGIPLGAMPTEIDTTGDVQRSLNGDSRIRGQDGFYVYSRVVVGPYPVLFGTLTIEDNAVLLVL